MKKAIFYYTYAKHLYLFILPKFGATQKGNANSLTNNSKTTFGGFSGRIFTTILYIYLQTAAVPLSLFLEAQEIFFLQVLVTGHV